MKEQARSNQLRRRYIRIPTSGTVRYAYGSGTSETASVVNVDRSGMCMVSSLELAPGQRLMLVAEGPAFNARSPELKGVVAWCAPCHIPGRFRVGVRIYCTDDETRLTLCALACAGLKMSTPNRHEERIRVEVVACSPSGQGSIDTGAIWFKAKLVETPAKQMAAANF